MHASFVIGLAFCAALFPARADACYQADVPSVQLRSRVIKGRVTLNGEPIAGAVLTLHKFLGAYSVEIAHADARRLGSVTTTGDGTFDFGEMPAGTYVIAMSWPSTEFTRIRLNVPKEGDNDTVEIEYFGDFCSSAVAITATGGRRTPRQLLQE